MNKKPQEESQSSTKPVAISKISAKKTTSTVARICQGDIFLDLEIFENIYLEKSVITVQKISFPYSICLNQECDLEQDYSYKSESICDKNLIHIAIAPAFIFEQFLSGTHWGVIFSANKPQNRKDTAIKKIIDNEIPRYHYLKFADGDMPELIVDFKHFFTINNNYMYTQLDKRLCSLDILFKEKLSQRFSYYISRIGLPEVSKL